MVIYADELLIVFKWEESLEMVSREIKFYPNLERRIGCNKQMRKWNWKGFQSVADTLIKEYWYVMFMKLWHPICL